MRALVSVIDVAGFLYQKQIVKEPGFVKTFIAAAKPEPPCNAFGGIRTGLCLMLY